LFGHALAGRGGRRPTTPSDR